MPESVNNKQVFSLLEVTKSIKKTLSDRYTSSFWVKAEMNKLNYYRHSGHCYPDLVEKRDGKIIAQIRSHIWKEDFNRVNKNFQSVLNEPLKDGIQILFQAKVSFDPAHGLALWITDIDPMYTLGDLEKEKQATIKQLREEGIFDRNKTLKLPMLPQRIAIISVETSKGYADFLDVIGKNSWGYRFFHLLFPSLLQGDNAVQSILHQLKKIKTVKDHFDMVAIIRGGGADLGLSCYNHYNLAREIALFPIPVLSGIGHSTNETVTEMVSFLNAITPTKLAEQLIQTFHNFSVPVKDAQKKLVDKSRRLLTEENSKFRSETKLFRSVTNNILITHRNELKSHTRSLTQDARFIFNNEKKYLATACSNMAKGTNEFFVHAKQGIKDFANTVRKDSYARLSQYKIAIVQQVLNLRSHSGMKFKSSLLELNHIEKNIANMSPANVLKRGYSITLLNGKAVRSTSQVKNGDTLNTTVFEGNIISIVNPSNKQSTNDNE